MRLRMQWLVRLGLAAALLCAAGCGEDPDPVPRAVEMPPLPRGNLPRGFVYRDLSGARRFHVAQGPIDPAVGVEIERGPDPVLIPLGINYAWPSIPAGAAEFKTTLPALAANGVNLIRVWQSTWGFDLGGWNVEGRLDGPGVAALDEVFAQAEKNKVKILLVYDNHFDVLNNQKKHGLFKSSGRAGALCGSIADYFQLPAARKVHAARLKALLEHYGRSPALFGIEFFNELDLALPVDLLHPTSARTLESWARFMAATVIAERQAGNLAAWHPMGVSTVGTRTLNCYADPRFDWTSVHLYLPEGVGVLYDAQLNETKLVGETSLHYEFFPVTEYVTPITQVPHRPWIMEYGFGSPDSVAKRNFNDPTGRHLRHALWAAIAAGGEGAPMPWWWDTYVLPNKLYTLYGPLSRTLAPLPWDVAPVRMLAAAGRVRLSAATAGETVNAGYHLYGTVWAGSALVYVARDGTAWPEKKVDILPAGSATVSLGELARGQYLITWLNPATGIPLQLPTRIEHPGGELRLDTPAFADDVALRLGP